MTINVELTDEESDALIFLLGAGIGNAIQLQMPNFAKAGIRVLNKMLANSPNYIPYDEHSLDPSSFQFPFKRVESQ